jgi:hypothetical protein
MTEKKGLPKPNYTGIPNALFAVMPEMKEAELRVVLAICRQNQELTGMGRSAVVRGIEQGVERGLIQRRPVRKGDPEKGYFYSLVVSEKDPLEEGEWYSKDTTSGIRKIPLPTPEVVSERYQQKKEKETIQKKTEGADAPPAPKKPKANPVPMHPFVTAYREEFSRYPNKQQMAVLSEQPNHDGAVQAWRDTLKEWGLRGWSPGNVPGMLERLHGNKQTAAPRAGDVISLSTPSALRSRHE